MKRSEFIKLLGQGTAACCLSPAYATFDAVLPAERKPEAIAVSGVYPHLAVFNKSEDPLKFPGECGIGAVMPWADRLWLITYSPHAPQGSADKLYSIDAALRLEVHPESVGGTPACRMIHRESGQLIIGPYFISRDGRVRVIPPDRMPGRLTAVARHLKDPANLVYFYDMEGKLYEANVHTLQSRLLFEKPIPAWHGKGAYTAQGRLILANNAGERHTVFPIKPGMIRIGGPSQDEEQNGVLAEWDGECWSIVRRRQFTEVTGPGGIYGAPDDDAPAWSLGWDKRSVILMLLDHGAWSEFRLPKATHTYDSPNGWYTEWPRIRAVRDGGCLMDMHGMLYNFPQQFSLQHTGGIRPLCSHLLMITDFCNWNGKLVLSTDETSMMENKLPGQSQSNLWFGSPEALSGWGPASGWGGVWQHDRVAAGVSSSPYLMEGFGKKVVHLSHKADRTVTFTLETCTAGRWKLYENIAVPPQGYAFHIFPAASEGSWVKVRTDQDCEASAYFHYSARGHDAEKYRSLFDAIAGIETAAYHGGLLRPAGHNTNLQYLDQSAGNTGGRYYEIDQQLVFSMPSPDRKAEVLSRCAVKNEVEADAASVIVKDHTGSYRLPRIHPLYDKLFSEGRPRARREVITERSLLNAYGTFYEVADESGFSTMRPVCSHFKKIMDFCSWRGLLVISGTKKDAVHDGHYFSSGNGGPGLWFGCVDDLWKLGRPVGYGGPWKDSAVRAGQYSLPYLMTGYDKKELEMKADSDTTLFLEVDFDHSGWQLYRSWKLSAGQTVRYTFPDGYSAHWLRVKTDRDARVSVQLRYS
ncbi:hypothetical protein [Compostibacter hankyongensis]|uniref:Uncharacterized protein n=1 Tax=Compostibacter hankyongensis TaxID=1007089 RepID=A0ABP8FS27_9BACT